MKFIGTTKLLKAYLFKIKSSEPDIKTLKLYIETFRHERLIHLLVMLAVAVITVITFLLSAMLYVLAPVGLATILMYFAAIVMACLLVAYIMHYFFLENSVQLLEEYYIKLETRD